MSGRTSAKHKSIRRQRETALNGAGITSNLNSQSLGSGVAALAEVFRNYWIKQAADYRQAGRKEEADIAIDTARKFESEQIADEDMIAELVDLDLTLHLMPIRERKTQVIVRRVEKAIPKLVLPEGLEELE